MYRQGDVMVVKTDDIFEMNELEKIERENQRIVLAYGEVTGHAHAIKSTEADFYRSKRKDVPHLYLVVNNNVDLSHEEHSTITIPPGKYRVIRQREYIANSVRTVSD